MYMKQQAGGRTSDASFFPERIWKFHLAPIIVILLLSLATFGAESDIPEKIRDSVGKYPELKDVEPELLYPQGSSFDIDRYGNFTVGGKIRWLLGTQPHKNYCYTDVLPTPGYPPELKWLYETVLNRDVAQRIGFDTISPFTSSAFLAKIKPEYPIPGSHDLNAVVSTNHMMGDSGLPLMVDFTVTGGSKDILNSSHKDWGSLLPKEALNEFHQSGVNHWVPYNVLHPAAREIYRTYWEEGALELTRKSPIVCYELFNEPGYDDQGAYNRSHFAAFLQRKYGTAETMNRIYGSAYPSFQAASEFKFKNENPGLAVDWSKFMEDSFASVCEFGRDVIRAKVSDARVGVQPSGSRHFRQVTQNYVNIFKINKLMNAVVLPTGGGITLAGMDAPAAKVLETPANSPNVGDGFLQRHAFRALADGKPIIDNELYVGLSEDSIALNIWLDMLRGANASYAFEWTKWAWGWKPMNSEGGRRRAQLSPYHLLNPYVEAELWGFMRVKREIFRFAPWFVPRQNRPESELAMLLSYPTERRAESGENLARNEIASYASALAFSHIATDALFEEQLADGREKRYKVIVAAGISHVYPETPSRLLKFVEEGGVLVIARSFMRNDEYGHPLTWGDNVLNFETRQNKNAATRDVDFKFSRDELFSGTPRGRNTDQIVSAPGWQTLATCGDSPALIAKRVGKGWIYVITPEMPEYGIASLLVPILERHGVAPQMRILRAEEKDLAVNVELHQATHNGVTLFFLANHDNYPKLVSLRSPLIAEGTEIANLLDRNRISHRDGTSAPIFLPPRKYVIVGLGKTGVLSSTFGELKESSPEAERETYKVARARYQDMLQQRRVAQFQYTPDPARTRTVDLRRFCNRGFVDSRADDGEGGWTDQGPGNSLQGVPWGVHHFLGVPCDLIRFDENNNKTCIVLRSKSQKGELPDEVKGIPVGGKVRALYFFHTVAWAQEKQAMTYRIHYASGKTLDVPVLIGEDVGNWWTSHARGMRNVAWQNNIGRGFYCMEWVNPNPGDDVVSLDLVSSNTAVVPIVIGITAEEYVPGETVKWTALRGRAYGNAGVRMDKELVETSVTAETHPWAGFECRGENGLPYRAGGVIRFEINGGNDRFGTHKGDQQLFMRLIMDRKSPRVTSERVNLSSFIMNGKVDSFPDTWQEVAIPLDRFKNTEAFGGIIDALSFQFNNCGHVAGIAIRNISVNVPVK